MLETDPTGIMEAARVLRAGGLVAYPTDTVYGLGCDPFNHQAVLRLISAKERTQGGLPILVDTLERAEEIGSLDRTALRLARRFWPGALTLVVPVRANLPPQVRGPSNTVGLRIPKHTQALEFIKKCHGAIIGTSANITGHSPPTFARELLKELEGRVDLVLDGGPATLGTESTVARVDRGNITILRERAVPREEIFSTIAAGPEVVM